MPFRSRALIASQSCCRLRVVARRKTWPLASITIRNLDDDVKTRLHKRAAANGRSMEEEARLILADAVGREAAPPKGLGTALHELFKPFGGMELELPPREPMREPPRFN